MRQLVLLGLSLVLVSPAAASLTTGPIRSKVCTFYEHRDMQGAQLNLSDGENVSFANAEIGSTEWRELPKWNDVVSSARVAPGCHVTVYEHMEGRGDAKTWHGGANGWRVNYVGGAWNDRISSARCYCR